MFKIGDFSKLAQVSTRMLRHYDQLGLLTPGQVDQWTGYRYYTIDQLPRLHRLIALKELGFSLEQVSQLLQSGELSTEQMRGMLRLRQMELQRERAENQRRLVEVEARLQQLERSGRPPAYEVVIKPLDAYRVASVRQIVPVVAEMGLYCCAMYERLYSGLRAAGIKHQGPEVTIYHAEEYREFDLDVESAVVVDGQLTTVPSPDRTFALHELPQVETAACLLYEGVFDGLIDAVLELTRWVGQQEYILAGPLRELHLSGPAHKHGDNDPAILELQIPIARPDPVIVR